MNVTIIYRCYRCINRDIQLQRYVRANCFQMQIYRYRPSYRRPLLFASRFVTYSHRAHFCRRIPRQKQHSYYCSLWCRNSTSEYWINSWKETHCVQLPTRLSLFKADNYIKIILRRLTYITAIQMDSERSNSRVSSKRYVISKYSSMSALLSRWYRCTGKRKKRYKSLPRTRTLQRPEKSERKADKPCWF